MILKQRKLVLRYSSPVTMWFGMLLACFAWVLHITPLLTPLWDDNAHLGHGICVELAPIVSVAKQYEQIQADITRTAQNLPDDSAAHHLHHHTAPHTLAAASDVKPTIVADAKAASKALPSKNDAASSDPDSIQHSSCDLCISMSAVLVPEVFAHTESALLELTAVVATFFYRSNTYYPSDFLQPLARAPPRTILT